MMHIAAESKGKWLTKDFLWYMFVYPFNQLKVEAIIAPIKVGNNKALNFVKRLGFKVEEEIFGMYKTTLQKEDCMILMQKEQ